MTRKVIVRKGGLSDFEEFYELFRRSLKDGYFLYSQNVADYVLEKELPKVELKKGIKKGEKKLFLAYVDDKLAGYLLTNKQNGGVAFGHWLGVDKNFRNQNVGTNLLRFWEKDAFAKGAHKLDLYTTRNDVGFYKKLGFTLAGECPDCWYGLDHFWFYKTLRKSSEKLFLKEFLKSKKGKKKLGGATLIH